MSTNGDGDLPMRLRPKHRVQLQKRGASMSSPSSLSPEKLSRLIGRPDSPILVNVRREADAAAEPGLVPTAILLPLEKVAEWHRNCRQIPPW
jgi:hypothetical protein